MQPLRTRAGMAYTRSPAELGSTMLQVLKDQGLLKISQILRDLVFICAQSPILGIFYVEKLAIFEI